MTADVIGSLESEVMERRSQSYRHDRILDRLRLGRTVTSHTLAAELGVSARTILRDLDALRDDHGAPIEYDSRGKTLRLAEPGWRLQPLRLNHAELFAAAAGAELAARFRGTPLRRALRTLFAKIQASLDLPLSLDPALLTEHISFHATPGRAIRPEVWQACVTALRRRRRLRLEYRVPGKPGPASHQVEPRHLACREADWYLIARRLDRDEDHVYAMSRILDAVVGPEPAQAPALRREDLPGDPFGRFVALGGKPLRVRVRFAPETARFVLERVWHAEQRVRHHDDGAATLTLPIPGEVEALHWVLQWGAGAVVLAPRRLRERVAQEARALAAAYRSRP